MPDRAGGHARPAPAAGSRRDRPAAPGRHPRQRGHRRQRADRRRDRPPRRHRRRTGGMQVVTGTELDAMTEPELDDLLGSGDGSGLRAQLPRGQAAHRRRAARRRPGRRHDRRRGQRRPRAAPRRHRRRDGRAPGTDVAREAATMVLTDDNFATIAAAVESGRRIYDNVRKFICYIFAHAVPEVVPFLVFALAGGAIPLPLTVMQILAIDLGTDTLPALALSREPAEPGLMDRPPRPRTQGVISRRDARPGLGIPRPDLRRPRHGRLLPHPAPRRLAPRRRHRARQPAEPRLPPGHHRHLARHRRLPGRHRVRGPHRPRLAALGRACSPTGSCSAPSPSRWPSPPR